MVYTGLLQLDTAAWMHRKQDGSIATGNWEVIFKGNTGMPTVEAVKTSSKKRKKNRPHQDRTMSRALKKEREREKKSCRRAEVMQED